MDVKNKDENHIENFEQGLRFLGLIQVTNDFGQPPNSL